MNNTAAYETAINFANQLNSVSVGLSQWAYKLAREGKTIDEIKAKLHAAMELSGR